MTGDKLRGKETTASGQISIAHHVLDSCIIYGRLTVAIWYAIACTDFDRPGKSNHRIQLRVPVPRRRKHQVRTATRISCNNVLPPAPIASTLHSSHQNLAVDASETQPAYPLKPKAPFYIRRLAR